MALAIPCRAAADKRPPPGLPLAVFWTVDLKVEAAAPPVSDGDRVFVALKSAHLTARAAADGHEVWRIAKVVTSPIAAADGLVFVSAGDAIEAMRGSDGGNAWIVPRVKTVAPLVARDGWVIAVTDAEIAGNPREGRRRRLAASRGRRARCRPTSTAIDSMPAPTTGACWR